MWRLLPPVAVAEAVWAAYHEDKLHWYVPPELAAFDVQVTAEPERARDERKRLLADAKDSHHERHPRPPRRSPATASTWARCAGRCSRPDAIPSSCW